MRTPGKWFTVGAVVYFAAALLLVGWTTNAPPYYGVPSLLGQVEQVPVNVDGPLLTYLVRYGFGVLMLLAGLVMRKAANQLTECTKVGVEHRVKLAELEKDLAALRRENEVWRSVAADSGAHPKRRATDHG